MINGELYAGGLALNFFSCRDFEIPQQQGSTVDSAVIARNMLRVLMMGWSSNWREIITKDTLRAIFVEDNPELTRSFRLAFQEGLTYVFHQLVDSQLTKYEHRQAEFFISNCLTILPYMDANPFESIAIPQWLNDQWQLVEYKITPIELTPTKGFKAKLLKDEDRVFAFGLEPIRQPEATPHLIFMGTTYPAGQGFAPTIHTDLEGFETAGKSLYRTGHKKITEWLNNQTQKPHVCGSSLGGALSLLLAIHQGDKLSRVDALNPPGLYQPLRKSRFDNWDTFVDKPEVFVQKQGDDPVSKYGLWKKEWHILHVNPPQHKRGPNSITDHALNYAGFADTTFTTIDTIQDNNDRKWRDILLYRLLRGLTYYTIVAPIYYVALPILRFALHHKMQVLPIVALPLLVAVFPALSAMLSSSFIFALAILPLVYCTLTSLKNIPQNHLPNNGPAIPKRHQPAQVRNLALDIYANNTQSTFSLRDIGDYYHVIRSLKEKPLLPPNTKFLKGTIIPKKTIMEQYYKDPLSARQTVTIHASKAKIHHIHHTVRLIRQFGLLNEGSLHTGVRKSEIAYQAGKTPKPSQI